MYKRNIFYENEKDEYLERKYNIKPDINTIELEYIYLDNIIIGLIIKNGFDKNMENELVNKDLKNIKILNFADKYQDLSDIIDYEKIDILRANKFNDINKIESLMKCINLKELTINFSEKDLLRVCINTFKIFKYFSKLKKLEIVDLLLFSLKQNCLPINLEYLKIRFDWRSNIKEIEDNLRLIEYNIDIYPQNLKILNIEFYLENGKILNLPSTYLPDNLISLILSGSLDPLSIPKNIKNLNLYVHNNLFMKNDRNGNRILLKNYLNDSLERLDLTTTRTNYPFEMINESNNNKYILNKEDLPDSLKILEIGGDVDIHSLNSGLKELTFKEFSTYQNVFECEGIELKKLNFDTGEFLIKGTSYYSYWLNSIKQIIINTKCKSLKLPFIEIEEEFMEEILNNENLEELDMSNLNLEELDDDYINKLFNEKLCKKIKKIKLMNTYPNEIENIFMNNIDLYEEVIYRKNNKINIYRNKKNYELDYYIMRCINDFYFDYIDIDRNFDLLIKINEKYSDKIFKKELLKKIYNPLNINKLLEQYNDIDEVFELIGQSQ